MQEKGVRVTSPRDAIRAAFQDGLIADDPRWLEMIETRNLTSHVYEEDLAEEIYGKLKEYLPYFSNLAKKLGKNTLT